MRTLLGAISHFKSKKPAFGVLINIYSERFKINFKYCLGLGGEGGTGMLPEFRIGIKTSY